MLRRLFGPLVVIAVATPVSSGVGENLLANPGFDSSLAGWQEDGGHSQLDWSAFDRRSDPDSGSALVTDFSQPASVRISQCIAVSPERGYAFGASIWLNGWDADTLPSPNPVEIRVVLDWFPDAGCSIPDGVGSEQKLVPVIGSSWADIQGSARAPAFAVAALVSIRASSPGVAISMHVDDAYVFPDTSCLATDSNLCLSEGRFRVSGSWRIPTRGQTGYMRAIPVSVDSGLFWFFSPANVEIIVKVLDACSVAPNRFWVFAAGMTNVETFLRVEDTTTPFVLRSYSNAYGTPFVPVQDTAAFLCP